MKEYYSYVFIINNKEYYCIWYSNEKDGFVVESNKVKCFESFNHLKNFATENKINFKEEKSVLSIDNAINWLDMKMKKIDSVYFLDFWNIVSDVAYSVGENFYGNKEVGIINKIYNKLFYGNNLPVIKHNGEEFAPRWDENEVRELTKIVRDGLRILRAYLSTL